MRYTINLDCKTHTVKKDGTIPLLLRVSLNGQHIYINLGRNIKLDHYDKVKKCVKSGVNGSQALISFIDRHKVKIEKIIDDSDKHGTVLSGQRLREIYNQLAGNVDSGCFYSFVEKTIEREREINEISEGTLNNYCKELKKLKKYRVKLSIHDISKEFLENYKTYILDELKHANNTAFHGMTFLRKYTLKLFKQGKIGKNPFDEFVVGKPFEVDPEYLEPEELNILHDLYLSKKLLPIVKKAKSKYARDFDAGVSYQEVLRYYLAACYCGLRHSDIKTLEVKEIKGKYIVKELQKGRLKRKKTVRIPLNNRLLSVLDMKSKSGLAFENPVMENSQTNKHLKKITEIASIKKHITFHSSRHTFAINSLILGISIEVISDILGHSELSTTQRYARVVDTQRVQQMSKWDKIDKAIDSGNNIQVICPSCGALVMRFEEATIRMNKINCTCQFCNENFVYSIGEQRMSGNLSVVA